MSRPDYSRPSRVIGRTLRRWRKERGLSLREVDEASRECHEPVFFDYVSRLENGKIMPSVPKLVSLASVYGRPVSELIDLYEVGEFRRLVPRRASYSAFSKLGAESLDKGEFPKALACFLGGLDAARREKSDPQKLAEAYANVGHALNKAGRYRSSIQYLEDGLRLVEQPTTKARLLDSLADAHYQLDNLALAELLARQARLLAAEDPATRTSALGTLSVILVALGRYEEAEASIREAIEGYRKLGDETGEIRQLSHLGHCLVLAQRPEEGLKTLREATARAAERGDPGLRARSLNCFGRALFTVGRGVEAKGPLLSSLRIAEENGLGNEVFIAAYHLWRVAKSEGAGAEALEHLEKARSSRRWVHERSEEVKEFDSAKLMTGDGRRGAGRGKRLSQEISVTEPVRGSKQPEGRAIGRQNKPVSRPTRR